MQKPDNLKCLGNLASHSNHKHHHKSFGYDTSYCIELKDFKSCEIGLSRFFYGVGRAMSHVVLILEIGNILRYPDRDARMLA